MIINPLPSPRPQADTEARLHAIEEALRMANRNFNEISKIGVAPRNVSTDVREAVETTFQRDDPTRLLGDAHNWNLDTQKTVFYVDALAAVNITGIANGVEGKSITIINKGLSTITLKHNSSESSAANRFRFSTGADVALAADASVLLVYDADKFRWRDRGGASSGGGGGGGTLSNSDPLALGTVADAGAGTEASRWDHVHPDTGLFLANGTRALTGDLDFGTHKGKNAVDPVANQDVATKKYVDDLVSSIGGATPISLQVRRPLKAKAYLATTLATQNFGATGVSLSFTVDEAQDVTIHFGGSVNRNSGNGWDGAMGFRITCASPVVDSTYKVPKDDFSIGSGSDAMRGFPMAGHVTLSLAAGTYTVYLHWGRLSGATDYELLGESAGYESGISVDYTNRETVIGSSSGRSARLYNYERCS